MAYNILTPVVYTGNKTTRTSMTWLDDTYFVIAYRDNDNSFYGTVVAGKAVGDTITLGTPVVFYSGITYAISVNRKNDTEFYIDVIANLSGNYRYGTHLASITDTSISIDGFGFWFSDNASTQQSYSSRPVGSRTSGLDAGAKRLAHGISGGSMQALFGFTTSATSITNPHIDELEDLKKVIGYTEATLTETPTVRIVTYASDFPRTPTFGAETAFSSITNLEHFSIGALDSSTFVVSYSGEETSNYLEVVICSVSGSTITAGTPFNGPNDQLQYSLFFNRDDKYVFPLDSGKFAAFAQGNDGNFKLIEYEYSGTTVSSASANNLFSVTWSEDGPSVSLNPSNRIAIAGYNNTGDSVVYIQEYTEPVTITETSFDGTAGMTGSISRNFILNRAFDGITGSTGTIEQNRVYVRSIEGPTGVTGTIGSEKIEFVGSRDIDGSLGVVGAIERTFILNRQLDGAMGITGGFDSQAVLPDRSIEQILFETVETLGYSEFFIQASVDDPTVPYIVMNPVSNVLGPKAQNDHDTRSGIIRASWLIFHPRSNQALDVAYEIADLLHRKYITYNQLTVTNTESPRINPVGFESGKYIYNVDIVFHYYV